MAETERKLTEAAIAGNTESLHEILRQDPLILDKIVAACVSETPLHVASLLGHVTFVKELLSLRPELATESDAQGCTPLHLAAARGHVDTVREILRAGSEVGLLRNSDGRTALHVAAVKGRAGVAAELIRVRPELTRALTDRGETALHLCVRYNRLEVLRLLTEFVKKDVELVNWRDSDVNTILHIAVAKKQIEMINYLLTVDTIDVNALNKNGYTALDVLIQTPRDLRDMEIEESIRKAGGVTIKNLNMITNEWSPEKPPKKLSSIKNSTNPQVTKKLSSTKTSSKKPPVKHKHTDWLGRKKSALMVVASLIATVAFTAGLTPPGGVWQDDLQTDENGRPVNNPHTIGQAVMAYTEPKAYGVFMIFNTLAFLSSLSIILLLVSGLPLKRRRWMWIQMVIMWIAISALVATYFVALRHMSPKDNDVQSMLREVTEISVLTWLSLMGVVFIGNIVRMNLWILRKYGYIKEKKRDETSYRVEDDDEDV